MKDITEKNFGMLISFSLPGFILLYSLSFSFPELKEWLAGTAAKDSLSVGDFLYSALASLSLGLLLSAIRWFTVDSLLKFEYWVLGQQFPTITISSLRNKDVYAAFSGVNENHYRYYQYYSNSLVALAIGFLTYRFVVYKPVPTWLWWGFFAIIGILLVAGRNCFRMYYERAAEVTKERTTNDQRLGAQAPRNEEGKESEERGEEDSEEGEKEG